MIVAGCDIGSLTAKAVLMESGKILSSGVIQAKNKPSVSAEEVMQMALEATNLQRDSIAYVVGTGYGRSQIPFVDSVESEISCHARGARHLMPSARMVIDIGGQDAKATRMDEDGKVARFIYNDKCASGTGRFLEIMAEALEIPLAEMGNISAGAKEKLTISNQCVIFAETEVISLVNDGKELPDIVNALHRAIANRVAALACSIGIEKDVVMTGGVAKNSGVFQALCDALNIQLKVLNGADPQIIGALGAALYAQEQAIN
ncbi:MAG: 2-hydroxyglutaryl-CoA dehydratase [Deltaproteobacteria bacterium]|nr:2-hydroxyglutaryl-CoA dehydratase [Deltaproteobacteria bacterium]